ncbi:MAG: hypothetical protein ACRC8B_22130, partial [Aeromonas sobria]|uniref:hypothetical protein n=1 Tax=Aeromonas sobria TaxID=646 RepID=UPI003F34A236
PVVLRPIGDGVKRFTHDADLRGMVVIRSLGFQLVPFKLHRFRKQRRKRVNPTQVERSQPMYETDRAEWRRPSHHYTMIYT